MRYRKTNNDLKIYAMAGTQTVLLSLDLPKSKVKDKEFLGFDIRREDKNGKIILLNGSKTFKSLVDDATITDPAIKFRSLVQSFFWKDYLADPGETYKYTVKAMFGTPLSFEPRFSTSIRVTTEELMDDKHSIFFNFGVTGCQAYRKKFQAKFIEDLPAQEKKEAFALLGRELWTDGLVEFVAQAKSNKYQLYGAFYELEYPDFLKAVKTATNKGASVEIVYSAKTGQKDHNEHAIADAAITKASFHPRTKVSQPHNKFMILCHNNVPKQVWTGSTNITLRGIFGHSNTGHWIKDPKIAGKYFQYWQAIKGNISIAATAQVSEQVQPDTDLKALANGVYVFFSPRKTDAHLFNYVDLINKAKELVCMIFPFNIESAFLDMFSNDKEYLRLVLFEKESSAVKLEESKRIKSNDVDLKITAGAILNDPVEQWVKEITSSTTTKAGIRYVHNKFFIVDALGETPVVVSGSANFSDESITRNDENTLVIKGDKRVADIYLTEFNRMFEHFWPRYLRKRYKSTDKGFEKPLDETHQWFYDYYDVDLFVCKRRKMFIKMKGTRQG